MNIAPAAFSLALVLACIAAWLIASEARAAARAYVRFAAVLYIALVAAGFVAQSSEPTGAFARAVALLVCVLAPCCLSMALLAMFRKWTSAVPAAIFLPLACLGGLAAAITDVTAFGFVPLVLASGTVAFASLRATREFRIAAFEGAAAALAFLLAASSLMADGIAARAALDLFSAAGLLGSSLALARGSRPRVEKEGRRPLSRVLAVREKR